MPVEAFESVEAYYLDDERRRRSPELDYGVWWRRHGVVYRLTFVEDPGELVAVQLSPSRVQPFAVPVDGNGASAFGVAVFGGVTEAVVVIANVEGRERVEDLLEGWADVCGADDSLVWVLRRLADENLYPPAA